MRGSLYVSLIISLVAMVVTMLFVSVIVRRERVSGNRSIVLGSAIMMSAGSVLTPFSDPTTPVGMLVLGLSAVMTGTGSAVLFLCWIELESGLGGRLALVELASSLCIAFVVGFLLIVGPAIPVMSAHRCHARAFGGAQAQRARSQLPRDEQPLSRHTATPSRRRLGAVLIGMLMGLFDVVSGFKNYEVQDIFGTYLFLAGLWSLAICLIAVFLQRDSVFFSYRVSMLMLLGCLSTRSWPTTTRIRALIRRLPLLRAGAVRGVHRAAAQLPCEPGADDRPGSVRTAARPQASLFAHSLEATGVSMFDLTLVTLVAVSLLFIAHLFLFTETDLIKIGIGEVSLMGTVKRPPRPARPDPCADRERCPVAARDRCASAAAGGAHHLAHQETLFISAGT
ncbi:MAG: LuxR family transcriptional regulator [Eggerthellaceae bacterium]